MSCKQCDDTGFVDLGDDQVAQCSCPAGKRRSTEAELKSEGRPVTPFVWNRQHVRVTKRELLEKPFDRARICALQHGWVAPSRFASVDHAVWRQYWGRMADYTFGRARGVQDLTLPADPGI